LLETWLEDGFWIVVGVFLDVSEVTVAIREFGKDDGGWIAIFVNGEEINTVIDD
jgi:hypothetical protein